MHSAFFCFIACLFCAISATTLSRSSCSKDSFFFASILSKLLFSFATSSAFCSTARAFVTSFSFNFFSPSSCSSTASNAYTSTHSSFTRQSFASFSLVSSAIKQTNSFLRTFIASCLPCREASVRSKSTCVAVIKSSDFTSSSFVLSKPVAYIVRC